MTEQESQDGFRHDATVGFIDLLVAGMVTGTTLDKLLGWLSDNLSTAYESKPERREDIIRLHARFVASVVEQGLYPDES